MENNSHCKNCLIEEKLGFQVPNMMRENFREEIYAEVAHIGRPLTDAEKTSLFVRSYVNISTPLEVVSYTFEKSDDKTEVALELYENGKKLFLEGRGNGQLNATAAALIEHYGFDFTTVLYSEHALDLSSKSRAVAYIGLKDDTSEKVHFACAVDTDIMKACIKAMVGAYNKYLPTKQGA